MNNTITWSDLLTMLTSDPLHCFAVVGHVVFFSALRNWWKLLITIPLLWFGRKIFLYGLNKSVPRIFKRFPSWGSSTKGLSIIKDRQQTRIADSRRRQRSKAVMGIVKSVLDPVMGIVGFFIVGNLLGVETSSFTGKWIMGALSIGLGLGIQGLVKDAISGIMIVLYDQYGVGDYVDTQFGVEGTVVDIGMVLVTLEATDGTLWFVRHSQIAKMGNKTASRGIVSTDITLSWNKDGVSVQRKDLEWAEKKLDETIQELSDTLETLDNLLRFDKKVTDSEDIAQIAGVIPDLTPTMGADTLYDMKAIDEFTIPHDLSLSKASQKIAGRVPVFTRVESLGFVKASKNSATFRFRIHLPSNASRSIAMGVLTRAVLEAFIDYEITPDFENVPESDLPVLKHM